MESYHINHLIIESVSLYSSLRIHKHLAPLKKYLGTIEIRIQNIDKFFPRHLILILRQSRMTRRIIRTTITSHTANGTKGKGTYSCSSSLNLVNPLDIWFTRVVTSIRLCASAAVF